MRLIPAFIWAFVAAVFLAAAHAWLIEPDAWPTVSSVHVEVSERSGER
jgi:hypothetical protein